MTVGFAFSFTGPDLPLLNSTGGLEGFPYPAEYLIGDPAPAFQIANGASRDADIVPQRHLRPAKQLRAALICSPVIIAVGRNRQSLSEA
jgi:hypothetical protein